MADLSHAALVLLWVDGRSIAEAAKMLGVTPAHIRNRMRRALPIVRAALAAHGLLAEASHLRPSIYSYPGEVTS